MSNKLFSLISASYWNLEVVNFYSH